MTEAVYQAPVYSVRISRRAKYLRLTFTPGRELEVVVPRGYNHALIPEIVRRHDAWIRRAQARLAATRTADPICSEALPNVITFACTGEEWALSYREDSSNRVTVREAGCGALLITGPIENHHVVRAALRLWIRRRAAAHLEPWLSDLAREHGFHLAKVSIRSQKTRWGSCSSRKTVSLNLRLMFLPRRLVRYVLLHELAHTKQLNHSLAFWKLVESLESGYRQAEAQLRAAENLVPAWLSL
jgi:predicted metal-dependent hydrolase